MKTYGGLWRAAMRGAFVLGLGMILAGCCYSKSELKRAAEKRATAEWISGVTQFRWTYGFEDEPGDRFWVRSNPDTWREIYPSGRCKTFRVVEASAVEQVSLGGRDFMVKGQIVQATGMNGEPIVGSILQVLVPSKPHEYPRLMMRTGGSKDWVLLGVIQDWKTAVTSPVNAGGDEVLRHAKPH